MSNHINNTIGKSQAERADDLRDLADIAEDYYNKLAA